MSIQFRPSTKHLPTLLLMAVLLLASLPSNGYSQSDSLFDCFPLSVGSQWEYQFIHFYETDRNPDWYGITDTGAVTYRVIRKWEYPDSVLWLFRQTRVLHRTVYDSWVTTSDSMVVDTTAFMLVELTSDRHELFLQRAVYVENPSNFGANYFNFGLAFWRGMPDSLKVYRYSPVDSTATAYYDFWWPKSTFPLIRRILLKRGVGADSVLMSNMATGSRVWSSFRLHSYSTIASARDFYPLEVGNRWNYHLLTTYGYQFYDTSNVEIRVVGDTLMPNGRVYAHLNQPDILGATFGRTDSDYVYYYSPHDSTETAVYNLRDSVGTVDTINWGGRWGDIALRLSGVASINEYSMFGVQRIQRAYGLGGLLSFNVILSDGIGPSQGVDMGDGGPYVTTWALRGAVICGTVYGVVSTVAEDKSLPVTFELFQNYPNPFNPSTAITYEMPKSSHVTLTVYDILGRQVSVLVNEKKDAGIHEVKFDASGLSSGLYFYRLTAGSYVDTKKLLLVK